MQTAQHVQLTSATIADKHQLEGRDAIGGCLAWESLQFGQRQKPSKDDISLTIVAASLGISMRLSSHL